ncbi:putative allantoin permease [Pseudovirgaria hyperparasitica]|uniref:Putative allantoin permease n=1 Tax=Pseudovirgaria hyperparasitica TaxID=470096 RepID=A0A6A6W5X8_9PEZI|nr:putative allantoin permease [Pseudovirgaria hyperparasitica]KAF2756461.1 putative allantoin permease [Pseudovirgaria hyperparasitica]
MMLGLTSVKNLFSSIDDFKRLVRTKEAPAKGKAYFNEDLLPTRLEHRKWNMVHFFTYYLTQTFSPGSYNLGATLIATGLQWWHGIIAAVIGSVFLSIIVILNSRGASRYHIGFPVYVRASSGLGGARLFIGVRASVAVIYFATQSFYGGMLMSVCLRAIFGHHWTGIPNHLPVSAGITSGNLLAFFIFWLIQLPVMFLHPTVLRHLFVVKAVYTTTALLGMLGWAVSKNGGTIGGFAFTDQKVLTGSALVWPMIQAINSVCGALCPILVNQPDVARYAARPSQATWSQAFGILISKVLVMFISCATTSATTGVLGKSYWNVWDAYGAILDQYWNSTARAGIFFVALSMVLAILATNAGSNSLPVGADTSGLFPRYVNIVRGQVVCALLAPLCVPWKIISSASSFLVFLGSYTVFLMPIVGIMIVDYWVLRNGNFHVPSLYEKKSGTPYEYTHGWNLRAIAAWIAGVAFTVHGIAGSLDPDSVNQSSKNMYKLGFFLSFAMGAVIFYCLSLIWPTPVYPASQAGNAEKTFEYMAATEGFFSGESVDSIKNSMGVVGIASTTDDDTMSEIVRGEQKKGIV